MYHNIGVHELLDFNEEGGPMSPAIQFQPQQPLTQHQQQALPLLQKVPLEDTERTREEKRKKGGLDIVTDQSNEQEMLALLQATEVDMSNRKLTSEDVRKLNFPNGKTCVDIWYY